MAENENQPMTDETEQTAASGNETPENGANGNDDVIDLFSDSEKPAEDDGKKEEQSSEPSAGKNGKDNERRNKKKDKRDKNRPDHRDEEIAALKDKVLRQQAEFVNFRNRTEKEKSQMFEVGAKSMLEKMLPTIDNFERGLAMLTDEQKAEPFAQGMEKTYRQMLAALESAGVKQIEAVGKPFDPNLHNAVMHVEDDSVGENIVVEDFQKGYMYRDSVLRFSMVKVAN